MERGTQPQSIDSQLGLAGHFSAVTGGSSGGVMCKARARGFTPNLLHPSGEKAVPCGTPCSWMKHLQSTQVVQCGRWSDVTPKQGTGGQGGHG